MTPTVRPRPRLMAIHTRMVMAPRGGVTALNLQIPTGLLVTEGEAVRQRHHRRQDEERLHDHGVEGLRHHRHLQVDTKNRYNFYSFAFVI